MAPGVDSQIALTRALAAASSAINLTSPNPRVGCVIASQDGNLLGVGHTQRAGGAHAEIMALRDAHAQGHSVQGAIAYVTLEPCSHHGRTGPCCDALIAAGVKKLVATNLDPNPLVAGQGFERMRAAGVEVMVVAPDDPLAQQARELNIGFFSRMVRKTPWVRMKVAASVDGITALDNGQSQWITSLEARTDGHAWRARACAILTGIGTVLADDPQLDVRLVETVRQPAVIVVDSRLETPHTARLLTGDRRVLIYTVNPDSGKRAALEALGATVVVQSGALQSAKDKVDLRAMLYDLGQREINELHVEAGHKLNGSLLNAALVDELLVYIAPKLIGQGMGMANIARLTNLADATPLVFQSLDRVGPDIRLVARLTGRDNF